MKRLLLVSAMLLGLITPASSFELISLQITTASGPLVSPIYQTRSGPSGTNAVIQCIFTYGSGGTTADAYVQTSIDGGNSWIDVAHCSYATASLKGIYNVVSNTPHATAVVPTDGSGPTANTANDGIIGSMWRVKYVTVGTYVGTSLRVDIGTNRMTPFP
jgi:hypothetical protein